MTVQVAEQFYYSRT